MRDDLASQPVKTTCPYCGVGCGVLATARSDGSVTISGDPEHPANFGKLCSKGSALAETLGLDGRLLQPTINGVKADWESALGLVAQKFSDAIREHGPESVAFYVSGQLLTEDYYVANKLMKGFIGSANIDTNSRLCMASSVAGHRRAFGSDTVPGCYEDLEEADLVVLVGSNLAWCHPVLFQRLAEARKVRGTKVVVIDPRETATCAIADQHLKITPGSDVALFNGLLARLIERSEFDADYIRGHTSGFEDAALAAQACSEEGIADITGLSLQQLHTFYDTFIDTARTVTIYSQGVNQSSAGTDKVNAIINCHLATGRIGKPGSGPFSVTGQPNAMGGREVGGLANMLAAHMEIDNVEHRGIVQTFWGSPRIAQKPGLKAVELFDAVHDGRIKALWIMATNPVVSLPEADKVRSALERCPFVVVSDVERSTDTADLAHVLLPSSAWGEKDGTVTNSERRISRQRTFTAAPGLARADWWQFAEVAKRMGFGPAFAWTSPSEIFAEYAALTGVANGGTRDLDLSRYAALQGDVYDALPPTQWPQAQGTTDTSARMFGDGRFFTPDRRARFIPTTYRPARSLATTAFPFILNTGRLRDQWHTMTRTGRSARLAAHVAEPFVEINPADATKLGLDAAGLARVWSPSGKAVLRVQVTDRIPEGQAFAPIHWTAQTARQGRIGTVIAAHVDGVSGQPELKHTAVALEPFPARWFGFATSTAQPEMQGFDYFATARTEAGYRAEIAGLDALSDPADIVARLWPNISDDAEILSYRDATRGDSRILAFWGTRLIAALFLASKPVSCARTFIVGEIGKDYDDAHSRLRLLAGRASGATADIGPIVCSCFGVGRNQIATCVRSGGADSVELVGKLTGAGTNCGSCRAEIGGIIHANRITEAV